MKVLIPYMRAYGGGIRRVLGSGLPRLAKEPEIQLEYAELCANSVDMDELSARGVPVNREIGVDGSGVLSHRNGILRRWDYLKAVPRVLRIISRLRSWLCGADVVYVHGYRELVFSFLAVHSLPSQLRPGVVWHCHGLGDECPPPLLICMANRCSRVIAVSQDVARRLSQLGVNGERVTYIPNAVDILEIRARSLQNPDPPLPPRESKKILLLPCAALRPSKGIIVALEGLAALPECFHLWITGSSNDPVGAAYLAQFKQRIDSLHLQERCHFIGPRNDVYAVIRESDVVLVPSLVRESFGLVAAEAMALGKPVVVSNRGALPEVVQCELTGLVLAELSGTALAHQITRLTTDSELLKRISREGPARVRERFRYDQWASRVAQLLLSAAPDVVRGPRVSEVATLETESGSDPGK